jgi:hypothetical protein
MKAACFFILLATFVIIPPAHSEILVFKNGQKIETNYWWKVSSDKIGFFYDGKEYHANKADIDWEKTEQLKKQKPKENKSVKVTAVSIEDFIAKVKQNLGTLAVIREVSISDGILKITTGFRSLDAATYNTMVTQICRDLSNHPEIAKTLKEIAFLSMWQTQGWVFSPPVKFFEVLRAPADEQETVIAKYSSKYTSN